MRLIPLDWIIVVISIAISFIPAILLARRAGSSTAEFFTSGRAAPWWLIGVSMVATTFSTDTPNLVTNLVREHGAETTTAYQTEYEHPIWKSLEERSASAGHGAMDYIEDSRLIQSLRSGAPTDMDLYDGASCTTVIMLSERSIANRSQPQDGVDFTGGARKTRAPLGIIDAEGHAVSVAG